MPEENVGKYFTPVSGVQYSYDYEKLLTDLDVACLDMTKENAVAYRQSALQFMCKDDLFFLLHFGLGRTDLNDPIGAGFFVDRCRDAQYDRNNTLDLWAREHGKSTIVTMGATVQDILIDNESTTGIFSNNRNLSRKFLGTIRTSLESPRLVSWFPEILYKDPAKDAERWGLDTGIVVKRTSARPESTVDCWGLVEGMPTGMHYLHRVYDDVVDAETVGTQDQRDKAWDKFGLSNSLKQRDKSTMRIVGTRYHYDDPYGKMISSGDYKVRIQTVYGDEKQEGTPVLFTPEEVLDRKKKHGVYHWNCQYLLQPIAPGEQKLKIEWVQYYNEVPDQMNVYIVIDPANEKKKARNHNPDYTCMWVVGFAPRGYVYVLDGVWGRLNLEERWTALRGLVAKWNPKTVGYEKYGKDSDIQHFEYRMKDEGFRFKLKELGGSLGKHDRIQRLVPKLCDAKLLFPEKGIYYADRETNKRVNLVDKLINEEMAFWPFSEHDDGLDCLSRIEDRDQLGVIEAYEDEQMQEWNDKFEEYEPEMVGELLI